MWTDRTTDQRGEPRVRGFGCEQTRRQLPQLHHGHKVSYWVSGLVGGWVSGWMGGCTGGWVGWLVYGLVSGLVGGLVPRVNGCTYPSP